MSLLAVSISVNSILYAVLIVGGVGLFIGIALGIAGKFLSVEVDEKEVAIREALPGNNCGGCGYPGCVGSSPADPGGRGKGRRTVRKGTGPFRAGDPCSQGPGSQRDRSSG